MKKVTNEIIEILNKMAENSFLMPDGFSDVIDLQNCEFSYKTYIGTRDKRSRYLGVFLYSDDKRVDIEIKLHTHNRQPQLTITKDASLSFSLAKILGLINQIYVEKHSFENHNEGVRVLRKKLRESNDRKKQIEKEIISLREQIAGLGIIKNN